MYLGSAVTSLCHAALQTTFETPTKVDNEPRRRGGAKRGMADFTTPLPQAGAPSASSAGVSGLISRAREMLPAYVSRVKALSTSFFNPLEFSRPTSQADWVARVSANALYFKPIYACFLAPILVNTMMSSLWLQIGSLVLCAAWGYAYGVRAADEQILGIPLSKFLTCSALSVFIMLLTGMINALFYTLVLFSLVGMPHMSLHNLPSAADALDAVEMQTLAPAQ
jgi:hypothetical protein